MDQIKKVSKGTQKSSGSKKGLGRGLSSLMNTGEAPYDNVGGKVLRPAGLSSNKEVPIEFLVANTYQPRMFFDEDKAKDLIASVKEKGILQPLLVRPQGKNRYEIVAGERRWRAAQVAGLHQVPVVIKEMNDEDAIEYLSELRQIGRWSAEMILLFTFNRSNIWPLQDIGLLRAISNNYKKKYFPPKSFLVKLHKKFSPYCSVATWYLWRSIDNEPIQY